MNYSILMQIPNCLTKLLHYIRCFLFRKILTLSQFLQQLSALYILHYYEMTLLILKNLKYANYIGMIKLLQNFQFRLQLKVLVILTDSILSNNLNNSLGPRYFMEAYANLPMHTFLYRVIDSIYITKNSLVFQYKITWIKFDFIINIIPRLYCIVRFSYAPSFVFCTTTAHFLQ